MVEADVRRSYITTECRSVLSGANATAGAGARLQGGEGWPGLAPVTHGCHRTGLAKWEITQLRNSTGFP